MFFLHFLSLFSIALFAFSCSSTTQKKSPFVYDLHLFSDQDSQKNAVICFHGFGGDYRIGNTVKPFFLEKATVISFNFPDYGKSSGFLDKEQTSFGTIEEILPALYVLKQSIVDKGFNRVCLYGFSAGGAALINCLSVLNSSSYDKELKKIGILAQDKKKILEVISQGDIILDTPLKSIDEIIALYGMTPELAVIGLRYQENGMDPIESLKKWNNLFLNILVHFQVPDKIVSNRDDELFIELLKKHNGGKISVLIGSDTGHSLPHYSLWDYYLKNPNCF